MYNKVTIKRHNQYSKYKNINKCPVCGKKFNKCWEILKHLRMVKEEKHKKYLKEQENQLIKVYMKNEDNIREKLFLINNIFAEISINAIMRSIHKYVSSEEIYRRKYKKCIVCGKKLKGKQRKHCSKKCERKTVYKNNKEKENEDSRKYKKEHRKGINEYKKKYRWENIEEERKKDRNNYKKNREIISIRQKTYYNTNPKKFIERSKEYRKKNKEKVSEQRKQYRNKKNEEGPFFKINHNMSTSILQCLKFNKFSKKRRHWESLVINTKEEIVNHLEKLFLPGMTWKNYGKEWVIDHIIPKRFFKFSSLKDTEFKYCWSLHNLQPLWEKTNLEKHTKVILWGKSVDARYIDKEYFNNL
jgi:hypothetical protein